MNEREAKRERWLPTMDLNHDKQIQSLLCYRYTIGQCDERHKVGISETETRNGMEFVSGNGFCLDGPPKQDRRGARPTQ